jgi:hypothetical protein
MKCVGDTLGGSRPTESSKEGYGSKRAVLPMMTIIHPLPPHVFMVQWLIN